MELVQDSGMQFINNLKGCTDSVSETRNELGLWMLEDGTNDGFVY